MQIRQQSLLITSSFKHINPFLFYFDTILIVLNCSPCHYIKLTSVRGHTRMCFQKIDCLSISDIAIHFITVHVCCPKKQHAKIICLCFTFVSRLCFHWLELCPVFLEFTANTDRVSSLSGKGNTLVRSRSHMNAVCYCIWKIPEALMFNNHFLP